MEAIATANTSRFFSTLFLFPKSLKGLIFYVYEA